MIQKTLLKNQDSNAFFKGPKDPFLCLLLSPFAIKTLYLFLKFIYKNCVLITENKSEIIYLVQLTNEL